MAITKKSKRNVKVRFAKLRRTYTASRIILLPWWKVILAILAVGVLYLGVSHVFSALALIDSLRQQPAGWIIIDTTLGPVRSHVDPSNNSFYTWILGWQSDLLYAVVFLIMSVVLLRLQKPRRALFVFALVALIFVLVSLWHIQQQEIHARTFSSSYGSNAEPYVPHLAYLRQCGDEIPYVFDTQTAGMMFRYVRDEGYTLAYEIPTNYGNPDMTVLCAQYDTLRKTYSQGNIVLQLYTKEVDGSARAFKYSDLSANKSFYGFFVR